MKLPSLAIASLEAQYRSDDLTPVALAEAIIAATSFDPDHVWITRLPAETILAYARALERKDPASLPLYGIPFAIKDNIDLAGTATTAACPDFAYVPEKSAHVVQRLIDAGAIPVGKTNLDQFATGLNGTRSPYGTCRNAFDPDYISGGSSSGSAVAVAKGLVSFSLGTDTAGSGRVPAAFNNLVGLKPTCGLLSTSGVVPACRSLDAGSVFALTAQDAGRVLAVARDFDSSDPYARSAEPHGFDFGRAQSFRFGVPRPEQLQFFGDVEYARLFDEAVAQAEALGGIRVEIDFSPFLEAARLLYGGPWVAERYQAIREFVEAHPQSLFPVTRHIIQAGAHALAADAFAAQYRLKALKRQADAVLARVDCLLTPTAGTIHSIATMEADPVVRNTELGYYTNFMNLLDYSAVAVPAGFRRDGLPFGVTFCAQAHQDVPLLHLAERWQQAVGGELGATDHPLPDGDRAGEGTVPSGQVRVAVCGAHLDGLPLNWQLTQRGARLVSRTRTAPEYRFYALAGGPPKRPGLIRVAEGGAAIEVEVWELPATAFGSFVAGIPAPLGIGKTVLEDGSQVPGFICEPADVASAEDITCFGSWRAYLGLDR